MLKFIDKQLLELEEKLDDMIRKSPAWREAEELLTSIPGVGNVTARTMLAEVPELGKIGRQQLASLIGVAPMNNDSGKHRGQRHIRGGRGSVRAALYMAALCAIRFNPALKQYYERLKSTGKNFKMTITACMRKLLIVMNSVMKNKTPFVA